MAIEPKDRTVVTSWSDMKRVPLPKDVRDSAGYRRLAADEWTGLMDFIRTQSPGAQGDAGSGKSTDPATEWLEAIKSDAD